MPYFVSVVEIALLIVLPLVLFYQWSRWSNKQYAAYVALLYAIWFFSYACLHELCHLFGSWIMSTPIADYRLIPHYWEGDFSKAYVDSRFDTKAQAVVSVIMPYLRDVVFLFVGYALLKGRRIRNHLLIVLILLLLVLSPLYDVVNNYTGYILLSEGDFSELSKRVGAVYANAAGVLLSSIAMLIALRVFVIHRSKPLLLQKN